MGQVNFKDKQTNKQTNNLNTHLQPSHSMKKTRINANGFCFQTSFSHNENKKSCLISYSEENLMHRLEELVPFATMVTLGFLK